MVPRSIRADLRARPLARRYRTSDRRGESEVRSAHCVRADAGSVLLGAPNSPSGYRLPRRATSEAFGEPFARDVHKRCMRTVGRGDGFLGWERYLDGERFPGRERFLVSRATTR